LVVKELEGHTETVEFIKFDSTGRWLVTGGMNNLLRIWDANADYKLHKTLDEVPQEDLFFVEWHPKAPLIMCGGVDQAIYLVNAVNGALMGTFYGHTKDILAAEFTVHDKAKQVISVSADMTVRRW
jgi:katanin p80 WD40 repeat-containing subunit B1